MINMTNDKFKTATCKCGKDNFDTILDANMANFIDVCEQCFIDTLTEVADEGKNYFYDWGMMMYGSEEKTMKLLNIMFNSEDEYAYEPEEVEGTMWMFTYGILKYPHNLEREGALQIIENSTITGHSIHLYNNSFPVTKKTGNKNDIVYGTLFEIPKSMVLGSYDYIEGYRPGRPESENMYNRENVEVTTPSGEKVTAEMYYANQRMFARDITAYTHIPTGNFDDKQLAMSFRPPTYSKKKSKKKSKRA
jgi:gamma-glutamylcyclotransferase (GGCT)/AIG2-like uncharacterized protein YtfP